MKGFKLKLSIPYFIEDMGGMTSQNMEEFHRKMTYVSEDEMEPIDSPVSHSPICLSNNKSSPSLMNGSNHRNSADLRSALRVHPEEEIGQPIDQAGTVAPTAPSQPRVRGGRTALEDTLGEWLNGNHQAELEQQQNRANTIRDELRIVYTAFQYEYRQNTRLTIMLQRARENAARNLAVVERIYHDFPHISDHYTELFSTAEAIIDLTEDEPDIINLTDDEIAEIIDLTTDSDSDEDMDFL